MTVRHRADITGLTPALRRNICELDMVQFGTESCAPGHSFGPAVRDHWLIHYVLEGCGRFSAEGREYTLGKGDGFLICPNRITWYGADWKPPGATPGLAFPGRARRKPCARRVWTSSSPSFTCHPPPSPVSAGRWDSRPAARRNGISV
jgi:hypothetical protein